MKCNNHENCILQFEPVTLSSLLSTTNVLQEIYIISSRIIIRFSFPKRYLNVRNILLKYKSKEFQTLP